MKIISFFLMAFSVLTVSAQSGSPKTEISINGKTFIKCDGVIYNKATRPKPATTKEQKRPEWELYELYSKVYLLNDDSEVKRLFRSVFPSTVIEEFGEEKLTIIVWINSSTGKVRSMSFLIDEKSPLYDIDLKILSDLEDVIISNFNFNIPDKSIPTYTSTLAPFKIAQLSSDKNLFPEVIYREKR